MRAAASRTFWTAGRSRPIRTAMIAITTSSSIRVKPFRLVERGMKIIPGGWVKRPGVIPSGRDRSRPGLRDRGPERNAIGYGESEGGHAVRRRRGLTKNRERRWRGRRSRSFLLAEGSARAGG